RHTRFSRDWSSDVCSSDLSIFDRPRPLAEATMRRIARGVVKHVLQAAQPFFLTEFANTGAGGRTDSAMDPLRTQCAQVKGGHFRSEERRVGKEWRARGTRA